MSEHTRIKFYSVHDLSFASNMKRVESFYKVPDPEYRLGKIGFTHCFSTSVPVCPAES